jgi:hypothetical protein
LFMLTCRTSVCSELNTIQIHMMCAFIKFIRCGDHRDFAQMATTNVMNHL